jgi:hypothetical protein
VRRGLRLRGHNRDAHTTRFRVLESNQVLSKPIVALCTVLPMLSFAQRSFAQTAMQTDAAATRAACVTAYESMQTAMKRSSLATAREHARVCLDDACSPALRTDCATWLTEIDKKQASFVVRYRDAKGTSRADVVVFVDGKRVATSLDGRGILVDPGPHLVRIEPSGDKPMEEPHVFNEGAKLSSVDFSRTPSAEPLLIRTIKPAEASRPIPLSTWVAGGIGAAAALSFVTFAIWGKTGQNRLDQCRPNCSEPDVSRVHDHYLIADVSLGVSAAGLAAALLLYVLRPSQTAEPETVAQGVARRSRKNEQASATRPWFSGTAPLVRVGSDSATIGLQGALP